VSPILKAVGVIAICHVKPCGSSWPTR